MNDTILWYTTRASGMVSIVLLSVVTALGLLTAGRAGSARWPRFLTAAVHRDLALTALVFLALHIVTAVVDPFTHLGLVAAAVPFGSYYRTFWLGLGTISFELMLAVVATSLLRQRIGVRAWRAVHWASYAMWPLAILHGLGTGTDSFSRAMLVVTGACCVIVVGSGLYRLGAPGDPLADEKRAGSAFAASRAAR
jgi:methionine sulfoxide reductase heme-binding subunit